MTAPPQRLLLILLAACGQTRAQTLKVPVQVDQSGKMMYFVVEDHSNIYAAAVRFCAAHLPSLDAAECVQNLVAEVTAIQEKAASEREAAQSSLPGLSFSVQNEAGEELRFTHEEGANPADEAREFCALHFESVPESACVESMLQSAQRALEEAAVAAAAVPRDEL